VGRARRFKSRSRGRGPKRRLLPAASTSSALGRRPGGVVPTQTESLAVLVLRYRAREDCTHAELARRTRISPQALHRAVTGRPVEWETVLRLARALGESPTSFKGALAAQRTRGSAP